MRMNGRKCSRNMTLFKNEIEVNCSRHIIFKLDSLYKDRYHNHSNDPAEALKLKLQVMVDGRHLQYTLEFLIRLNRSYFSGIEWMVFTKAKKLRSTLNAIIQTGTHI